MKVPDWLPEDAPDQLVFMSMIAVGQMPDGVYGTSLNAWLKKDPVKFQQKLAELNIAYWRSKGINAGEENRDEGVDKALRVLDEWLKEKRL